MKKLDIAILPPILTIQFKRFEESGNSLVLTAIDGKLCVLMGIRDQIRKGIKEDLQNLKKFYIFNCIKKIFMI